MSRVPEIIEEMRIAEGIVYFSGEELTYRGGNHENGRNENEFVPAVYWQNLIKIGKRADQIREAFGHPLRVVSGYRCPGYNASIGGVKTSQHLTASALDIRPVDPGKISSLRSLILSLHKAGKIKGGLGIYRSFIHIDLGKTRRW
jgi:hypothetical protein